MKNIKDLLQQVLELNDNRKFEQVVKLLPKNVLLNENSAELYVEAAKAYYRTCKNEESRDFAEKAIKLDKSNAKGYYLLGANYLNFEDHTKAKKYLLKSIELDEKFVPPLNSLGYLYLELKNIDKAKEYFLKSVDIDENSPNSYCGLGFMYMDLNDTGKAKEYFLKAIEKDQKLAYSFAGLGYLYIELKDYKKAEKYLLKSIALDKYYLFPYNQLGILYTDLKDYVKAKDYFQKVIDLKEKYHVPYNGLGTVYSRMEDYKKAEEFYSKAIKLKESFESPYYNLGLLYYFKIKDYKKAEINFKKYLYLKNNPNDVFYKRAVDRIQEIEKIKENTSFKTVNEIVQKLKNLLQYKGENITHYTSISTAKFLILKESPLRISEGSFLNDTSEGRELFDFLNFNLSETQKNKALSFSKRPFIGSFVDESKCDDLTLWRMYGKEALEEAKGCSITIKIEDFKESIYNKINENNKDKLSNSDEIEFYRVAYRKEEKFEFGVTSDKQIEELNLLMKKLRIVVKEFKDKEKKHLNEEIDILVLLNEVAYLFKSAEYQYENEIRLVVNDTNSFNIEIGIQEDDFKNCTNPPKVYIELVPLDNLLKSITIGPKVDRAEEWASTFYYKLINKVVPNINISTLPFK